MSVPKVTFDRPIEAKLYVHLANGETFEVKDEHLDKFGLVRRLDAYGAFDDHLSQVLRAAGLIDREVTEAHLNPLRWLVELAVCMPNLLEHRDVGENDEAIVAIERTLRSESGALTGNLADLVRDLLGRLDRTPEVEGLLKHLPPILQPTAAHPRR